MKLLADLNGSVTGFCVGEQVIDCMCGKDLLRLDKRTGEILCQKEIFEKEGLSRKMAAEGGQIFLYDFCTLYALNQEDFGLLGKFRLGEDLSSDLCGLAVDGETVYASVRNGKIVALDRRSFAAREVRAADSSMWSVQVCGGGLVCGTVDGCLLLLDKDGLSVEKRLVLGKKNIGSVYVDGGTLYAAGHDGRLFKIGVEDFAVQAVAKGAHKKMFHCAGVWGDRVVTVCYPGSEVALWDKKSLQKVRTMQVPLRLSGQAYIEGDLLYLASRNVLGIGVVELAC